MVDRRLGFCGFLINATRIRKFFGLVKASLSDYHSYGEVFDRGMSVITLKQARWVKVLVRLTKLVPLCCRALLWRYCANSYR